MPNSSNSLSAVLLDTNTDKRWTVFIHVLFWVVICPLFVLRSYWFIGSIHWPANMLIALSRLGVVLAAFYAISYLFSRKPAGKFNWLLVVGLAVFVVNAYCLIVYYEYGYVDSNYPGLPASFHSVAVDISQQGPWTFIKTPVIFDFIGNQLVISCLLPFAIKGTRSLVQSRLRSLALEKDNLKLELEFLRAQINPHFLFNTLNSVYALIEDKDKTAAFIVVSLSDMMRYALYAAAATEVDVAKELAFIQNYIEIQQIRHRRRLEIALEIAPDLGPQRIPPLLLINFVENAVKHGVDKLRHDAWVRIRAYRDEQGAF